MEPRPGDLVFVRGEGFVPWAIRQITGGHYNHVEIYVGDGIVVGSMEGKGIRAANLADYERSSYCFGRLTSATDMQSKGVALKVIGMKGASYDTLGILGIWFKFACKWAGIKWIVFWGKNKSQSEKRFWCSELVGVLYSPILRFSDDDTSWLTPTEICDSPYVVLFGEGNDES